MSPLHLLAAGIALVLAGCASPPPTATAGNSTPLRLLQVQPVVMTPRTLQPPASPPEGRRIQVQEGDLPFLLFLPAGWLHPTNAGRLAMHFHTADWVAIGEHLRAGYRFPVVSILLGAGSARYREPFMDAGRFPRLLKTIEAEFVKAGAGQARVKTVDVSSFSAGYGAVRELAQQPAAFGLIRRIVLSDSLYGGLSAGAGGEATRVVQKEHVDCWLSFARAAMAGEKTFVLTYSEILPSTYASTSECAAAILAALGMKPLAVPAGFTPAVDEPTYPLRLQADAGGLHFWGYAGADAAAHTVHPRRLAEVWMALDAATEP